MRLRKAKVFFAALYRKPQSMRRVSVALRPSSFAGVWLDEIAECAFHLNNGLPETFQYIDRPGKIVQDHVLGFDTSSACSIRLHSAFDHHRYIVAQAAYGARQIGHSVSIPSYQGALNLVGQGFDLSRYHVIYKDTRGSRIKSWSTAPAALPVSAADFRTRLAQNKGSAM